MMTMSTHEIPDAAVEAAARELFFQHSNTNGPSLPDIWDSALNDDLKSPFMRDARAALEAAAPQIRAQALEDAANAWREYLPAVAGYGVVQPVPVWLERRAEWVAS